LLRNGKKKVLNAVPLNFIFIYVLSFVPIFILGRNGKLENYFKGKMF